jgi:toxin ParE1/3/4
VSRKPVFRRARSRRDLEAATDYYEVEAGPLVAARFLAAVESVHEAIGHHPKAGSLRYSHETGIHGIRSRPVPRFPYLVIYVELHERIEVWRVLHAQSDIPTWLRQADTEDDPGADRDLNDNGS